MNKTIETISSETMNALCGYYWPGNIRELQNVIERAVILSRGPALVVPLAEMQPRTGPAPAREIASATPPRRLPVRAILDEEDRDKIIQSVQQPDSRVAAPYTHSTRPALKRTTSLPSTIQP